MTATTTIAHFADGTAREIPAELIVSRVRGLDADGDLVIATDLTGPDGGEYLIALTSCHDATGKGSASSATGVVCRFCYADVNGKFGGPATVAVPAVTAPMPAPRVIGDGVVELTFAVADPLPGCRTGMSLRVSVDGDAPVLALGAAAVRITDPATLDRLIDGLTAARARLLARR